MLGVSEPLVEVGLGLHAPFCLVGQRGEEVYARDALHLVDGVDIVAFRAVAVSVLVDEADGLRFALHAEHHLEESLGHGDAVCSYLLVMAAVENRTCHDIDVAIGLSPFAALYLHLVPVAAVQTWSLWTDIGQQETLPHRLLAPFVVACGTHVAAVETRPGVVVGVDEYSGASVSSMKGIPLRFAGPVRRSLVRLKATQLGMSRSSL